jgi:hypothetical protein
LRCLPRFSTRAMVARVRAELHDNGPGSRETAESAIPLWAGPEML